MIFEKLRGVFTDKTPRRENREVLLSTQLDSYLANQTSLNQAVVDEIALRDPAFLENKMGVDFWCGEIHNRKNLERLLVIAKTGEVIDTDINIVVEILLSQFRLLSALKSSAPTPSNTKFRRICEENVKFSVIDNIFGSSLLDFLMSDKNDAKTNNKKVVDFIHYLQMHALFAYKNTSKSIKTPTNVAFRELRIELGLGVARILSRLIEIAAKGSTISKKTRNQSNNSKIYNYLIEKIKIAQKFTRDGLEFKILQKILTNNASLLTLGAMDKSVARNIWQEYENKKNAKQICIGLQEIGYEFSFEISSQNVNKCVQNFDSLQDKLKLLSRNKKSRYIAPSPNDDDLQSFVMRDTQTIIAEYEINESHFSITWKINNGTVQIIDWDFLDKPKAQHLVFFAPILAIINSNFDEIVSQKQNRTTQTYTSQKPGPSPAYKSKAQSVDMDEEAPSKEKTNSGFKFIITSDFHKSLAKLTSTDQDIINLFLKRIEEFPRSSLDIKKLKNPARNGHGGTRRIKVGLDFRIFANLTSEQNTFELVHVTRRGNAYFS